MTFLVEIAPPGLGNLCQVLHSGDIKVKKKNPKSKLSMNVIM